MKNKRLIGIVLAVAILLLIPLIAGFPWTRLDFVAAGVLLLGTGFLCELVMRKVKRFEYQLRPLCSYSGRTLPYLGSNCQRRVESKIMNDDVRTSQIISWLIGVAVLAIGVLNLFLVHPIPGVFFLLLSLVYFPPADVILKKMFDFSIPLVVKINLGIFIIWFTLGESDLGDMID